MPRDPNAEPAFPYVDKPTGYTLPGMSLRDYFAAQAMVTLLGFSSPDGPHERAKKAYVMADAMLKARED